MDTETTAAAPTAAARLSNVELGELIGLSHSSASRVRSGQRAPGYRVMLAVEKHFDWTLQDQVKTLDRSRAKYGETLEEKATAYAAQRELSVAGR